MVRNSRAQRTWIHISLSVLAFHGNDTILQINHVMFMLWFCLQSDWSTFSWCILNELWGFEENAHNYCASIFRYWVDNEEYFEHLLGQAAVLCTQPTPSPTTIPWMKEALLQQSRIIPFYSLGSDTATTLAPSSRLLIVVYDFPLFIDHFHWCDL